MGLLPCYLALPRVLGRLLFCEVRVEFEGPCVIGEWTLHPTMQGDWPAFADLCQHSQTGDL